MRHLAAWYQKKISSYDKEEWETMVEQLLMRGTYRRRIVDFSSHPRSYLIDVDLVRGSSFPKAKPTLGTRRVVWFALVRLLFLPALHRWWAQQTSPACAKFLLALWAMQLINMSLYYLAPDTVALDPNCWLVPLALMLVLSVVHSQIVCTTELELARVRPRPTFRRKLPRYFRRQRSENEEGSAGDSGATSSQSKVPAFKQTKYRRRQSRADVIDSGLRKRKKELTKENLLKNIENCDAKPRVKVKAKDSDDEDYMVWKKPDQHAPIVTFTPPPDNAPSCSEKSSLLTKKRLETFNDQNINNVRANIADGDDGFESLNGQNSNGSDGDNKAKDVLKIKNETRNLNSVGFKNVEKNNFEDVDKLSESLEEMESKINKSILNTDVNKNSNHKVDCGVENNDEDEKSLDPDSDGAIPTSSPSAGKRFGVRFTKSWIKEHVRATTSDEDFTNIKNKRKKLDNYQSSSSDGECSASASAPSIALPSHHTMSDWVGQSTNSEESSYCSGSEGGACEASFHCAADSAWDPFALLDPTSDTVKCTMWEAGRTLRAELSAVDISWCVVARAERAMAAGGASWPGPLAAACVALVRPALTLVQVAVEADTRSEEEVQQLSLFTYIPSLIINYSQGSVARIFYGAFGDNYWELSTNLLSFALRLSLSGLVFFLLAVAERAFKQRFLYAKLFSHLTSARRARKSELPHFRLNTVRNIKTWLSTRSYLRRRGPQRSVDVIVSAAFVLTIVLLACVSAQLLRVKSRLLFIQ